MMYEIIFTNQFKRSLKRCAKRGLDIEAFKKILNILSETGTLPSQYNPHKLKGNYKGCWECHIKPDWLLVWQQNDTELILIMVDTGTHSDLF